MANDYISRETATKILIRDIQVSAVYGLCSFADIQRALEKIPAADVVPVVRCKDCIHWHESKNGYGDCYHIADRDCEGGASFDCSTEADDYCSHGSRMGGGEHHAE